MSFRTDLRAAAMTLLNGYKTAASLNLQTYRGRPAAIKPPCAFVEGFVEAIDYRGPTLHQRQPALVLTVLHGTFDSGESVDQADAFADGFLEYVAARPHAAGANTTVGITRIEDDPAYIPEWLPPERRVVFYATSFTLEGLDLAATTLA